MKDFENKQKNLHAHNLLPKQSENCDGKNEGKTQPPRLTLTDTLAYINTYMMISIVPPPFFNTKGLFNIPTACNCMITFDMIKTT